MRRLLLAISSIVLVGLIFVTYKAFTIPTKVEEQIVQLNYEHKGEFDCLSHLNASYLFDDIIFEAASETTESPEVESTTKILPSSPSTPKYPAEMIEKFDMTFSYGFLPDEAMIIQATEQVEIKVLLDKPTIGREEVILVPETIRTDDFIINFSLDPSELAASSATTIIATVYTTVEMRDSGPIFESFTQSLAIQLKGPLLEVDRELVSTQRAS
ncbi:hypothetical protein ACFLYG_03185, partial [Chloroflexota bacterium]